MWRISRATMGRIVSKLKLTRKKTLHATERDTGTSAAAAECSIGKIGAVNLKDLVFVDETGTWAMTTLLLAHWGTRAYS